MYCIFTRSRTTVSDELRSEGVVIEATALHFEDTAVSPDWLLVTEWAALHRDELIEDWNLARAEAKLKRMKLPRGVSADRVISAKALGTILGYKSALMTVRRAVTSGCDTEDSPSIASRFQCTIRSKAARCTVFRLRLQR